MASTATTTTTATPSPLMLNVINAYLKPLLQKHEKGQVLTHDDLLSSWEAADAILKDHGSASDFAEVVSDLCIHWFVK